MARIKDLIQNKDYDYIELRAPIPENMRKEGTYFVGGAKSVNGELIAFDGDTYSLDTEVVSCEEWSSETYKNGLTIVFSGNYKAKEE